MTIKVFKDEKTFDEACAEAIARQITDKPESVVGLSTGRTTVNMHRIAAGLLKNGGADLSKVTIFGVDEVTGVDKNYRGACYRMLRDDLVDEIGIPDGQFIMFPTRSDDFARDCRVFTEELERRGGIDLQMLGLGENGHLGFNQPGTPFDSPAGVRELLPGLEERIRRETGTPDDEELGGATLGLADIMKIRHIILVAKGDNKRDIVKRIIEGEISEDCPASLLQRHPNCEYWLDAKAAAGLEH